MVFGVETQFIDRKPRMTYELTDEGREPFEERVPALVEESVMTFQSLLIAWRRIRQPTAFPTEGPS